MTELAKQTKVLRLRSGVEFYLEEEEAQQVTLVLNAEDAPRFMEIKGRVVAITEVVGLFDPADLEALHRKKMGQWQDTKGEWHGQGEYECSCGNIVPKGMQCGEH